MSAVSREVLSAIDRAIKTTWLKNIPADWREDALLLEASLQCAFYYHLRRKLSNVLRENNLRIFSEYRFADLNLKADLAIVQLKDDWKDAAFVRDAVRETVAVIELKYTRGAGRQTEEWVKDDVRKCRRYLQEGGVDCQYYFAVLYERDCSALNWMDRRAVNHWAGGRMAELDAGYIDGHMTFEVHSYNGMNPDLSANE